MHRWFGDEPAHDPEALRDQVDQLMNALQTQRVQIKEIQHELAALQIQAASADGLVEVTVDADGTVVATRVTAKAMRTTPEKLESAFTEAARSAASAARAQQMALIAPLAADVDEAPGLSDLLPGLPSFAELRATVLGDLDADTDEEFVPRSGEAYRAEGR